MVFQFKNIPDIIKSIQVNVTVHQLIFLEDKTFICSSLDLINLMSYDLHGAWDPYTGHNAPLFGRPGETGQDVFFNVVMLTC